MKRFFIIAMFAFTVTAFSSTAAMAGKDAFKIVLGAVVLNKVVGSFFPKRSETQIVDLGNGQAGIIIKGRLFTLNNYQSQQPQGYQQHGSYQQQNYQFSQQSQSQVQCPQRYRYNGKINAQGQPVCERL